MLIVKYFKTFEIFCGFRVSDCDDFFFSPTKVYNRFRLGLVRLLAVVVPTKVYK